MVPMNQPLFVFRKNVPPMLAISGGVTLYQVTPPSSVRTTYGPLIAQPLFASIMDRLLIAGDVTTVPGPVTGVGVGVAGSHVNVDIICVNTADSAALSNSGGGVA